MDGGQVAITGFSVQVAIAILDALSTDDFTWSSMTIEPTSETTDYQKVDIRWAGVQGSRDRHVQVKHSRRGFTATKVMRWCEELAAGCAPASLQLVLVGAPTSALSSRTSHAGVEVVVRPMELGDMLELVAHRLGRLGERAGRRPDGSQLDHAAQNLTGRLLLEAARGVTWERSALLDFMVGFLPLGPPSTSLILPLRVRLFRTVVISGAGMVEEHVRFEYQNPTSQAQPIPFVQLVVTDPGDCTVLEVGDSLAGPLPTDHYGWGYNDDKTRFVAGMKPRLPVPPSGALLTGFHIQRTRGASSFAAGMLAFNDPLCATAQPFEADVVVVFPDCGHIEAWNAETSLRVARWRVTTGSSPVELSAVWRREVGGGVDPVAERQLALVAEHWARLRGQAATSFPSPSVS